MLFLLIFSTFLKIKREIQYSAHNIFNTIFDMQCILYNILHTIYTLQYPARIIYITIFYTSIGDSII